MKRPGRKAGKTVKLQPASFRATAGIKLEPHRHFKKAIIGVNEKGWYVYSFFLLVQVCQKLHQLEYEDAVEWVSYNICGLEPNGIEVQYEDDL